MISSKHFFERDAILLGLADAGTSFFAGSVIFMIIGYMAHELGQPVGEVIKSGPGLAFIAYPDAIGEMSVSPLWGVLFFSMLITCGFDTEVSFFYFDCPSIEKLYFFIEQDFDHQKYLTIF
jgi:SNF family Na+-dependent transporter